MLLQEQTLALNFLSGAINKINETSKELKVFGHITATEIVGSMITLESVSFSAKRNV